MIKRGMKPPHPGAMIRDIMEGIKEETGESLTIIQVADGLGVTRNIISAILHERQGISSEMAIRLAEAFGSTPQFWLKLQLDHDLWHADKKVNRNEVKHFWSPSTLKTA
ncbi:HigA family addiction module antitoxin [Dyadobacter sp. NIV53]|uniref:HigA family addiction module antitoxin n=1 Tax=Dyadobacter sp. NIV53 TaxID=2861765 RepID=UPI001C87D547|nr:HigA family addiction module antitoxin [Dyadobacter sp. NIV53]